MTEKDRMDLGRRRREQRTRRRKGRGRRALLVFLAAMALTRSVKTAQLSQTAGERDLPRNSREITAVSPAKAPESVKPPESAGAEGAAERPEDWRLLLVNPWKTLPEGYTVELQKVKGGPRGGRPGLSGSPANAGRLPGPPVSGR